MSEPAYHPQLVPQTISQTRITDLSVGQVVRFTSGKFGFIAGLHAEMPGHSREKTADSAAILPRYDSVSYYIDGGRVTSFHFTMADQALVMKRRLDELEMTQFESIVLTEAAFWKPRMVWPILQGMPA